MPRIVRLPETFSRKDKPGKIPVGFSKGYEDYIYHEGGDPYIAGTKIPRLRRINLGPRAVGFLESEVDRVIEALAAQRDIATAA